MLPMVDLVSSWMSVSWFDSAVRHLHKSCMCCAVPEPLDAVQFLNPWIMVKKGGKLPEGHINDWFWEDKSMKDYLATRLPKGTPTLSCFNSSQRSKGMSV